MQVMDTVQQVSDQAVDYAGNSGMSMMAAGGLMAFLAAYMVFILVIAVFMIIVFWKIFTKAGQPGWACLIPIYNYLIILKIAGKPWWWLLLMLIPIVNIVLAIIVLNNLSKSFGHGAGFTVGLLFLGIIFYPILAFGSSKYIGPGGVAPASAA
jgi:hypothetical protein